MVGNIESEKAGRSGLDCSLGPHEGMDNCGTKGLGATSEFLWNAAASISSTVGMEVKKDDFGETSGTWFMKENKTYAFNKYVLTDLSNH